MGMKYVIIGNSTAAVGAVEGIRQIDGSGEITVISNEKHHTYQGRSYHISSRAKPIWSG
jgi:NADPH-dependent 2,4-dienoyl-CoA reductase/sulfur reductase-like enzyme